MKDQLIKIWEESTEVKLLLERLKERLGDKEPILTEEERKLFYEFVGKQVLRDFHFSMEWRDASVPKLVKLRILPLALTFFLSFGSVIVYSVFHQVTAKYALYISMAPLISNVAGNYGLISASSVMRGLATVTFNRKNTIIKEVLSGLVCGLILGLIGGIVAIVCYKSIPMALTVLLSLMCALGTSGFFGAAAPLFFSWIGIDPARIAGPMETTLQDIVTYSSYFTFISLFMKVFGA